MFFNSQTNEGKVPVCRAVREEASPAASASVLRFGEDTWRFQSELPQAGTVDLDVSRRYRVNEGDDLYRF